MYYPNAPKTDLSKIQETVSSFKNANYTLSPMEVPFCYILTPSKVEHSTILGINSASHGNEVVGVEVINQFIKLIESNTISVSYKIIFSIGNPEAFKENKRFIDEDINRKFKDFSHSKNSLKSYEAKRSYELKDIFLQSTHLVDLHQTQTPTDRSFLLYPYRPELFSFLEGLFPLSSKIITFPKPDTTSIGTLSHFMYQNKKLAYTIELGEKGPYIAQLAKGISHLSTLCTFLEQGTQVIPLSFSDRLTHENHALYTFRSSINAPSCSDYDASVHNFFPVKKGQVLDEKKSGSITSPIDGFLIFPKFKRGPYQVQVDPDEPVGKIITKVYPSDIV